MAFWRQHVRIHGNHGGLLFHGVNVLHHPRRHEILPHEVVELSLLQHVNVPPFDQKLAILHNQQWATYPASISHDPDLSVSDVADHGDLRVDDVHLSPQLPQRRHQLLWISVDAHPAPVDKDLGGVSNGGGGNLLQVLHAPLLQELEDGGGGVADTDVSHQGEVLDEANSSALGGLGRADHAPEGVVQLPGLGKLTISSNG